MKNVRRGMKDEGCGLGDVGRWIKYPVICGVVLGWGLLLPSDSYAYLDPGTGSYFLQMLVGIFLAVGFTVKIYWQKIKSIFTGRKK